MNDKPSKAETTEYSDGLQPCIVAKKPCGCYVAACVINERILQEIADWDGGSHDLPSLIELLKDGREYSAAYEVRPVSFVRSGGLKFDCRHGEK